jgi:iron complex outermembrane recepter protein
MTHRSKFQQSNHKRFGISGSTLSSMRRVPQAAALLSLAGAIQVAIAQAQTTNVNQTTTGSTATGASGSALGSGQIEEIVVTAQRRSESMQEVPIAITAITASRLEAIGMQSTENLGEVTPGLSVPADTGYFQPHIRGVGTSSTGAGVENPVALYIDGVYIANPPSGILSLNNIDRIEVDKGPQGTLFGRNATGGLIQVITRDPQQTAHLDADVSYGNYQDVVGRLYATAGLTSDLAADVAVRYEHQGEGLGHNFYDGSEIGLLPHDLAFRSKFLFEPSSETQARLTLDYEDRGSDLDQPHLGTQYPGSFNNAFFGGPFPQGGPYDKNENAPFQSALKAGGAALQINQALGSVALESITGFRKSTYFFAEGLDYTPLPILSAVAHQTDQQLSQELRVSGNNDKLRWTGGLYYFYAKDGFEPFDIDFGPTPVSPVFDTPVTSRLADDQITNSAAGYGQASYKVVENTNLTLGGRYTYERKSIGGTSTFIADEFPVSTTPYPAPGLGFRPRETFDNFSYRIALDHKFTSAIMGYMSYSTGFKSGGYNLASASNPPYQPENIKASEVGLKSELFDKRLRLNVSAFNYLYDNIQVGEYIENTEIIVNGAKAKMYGADIDAELAVVAGLTLYSGFSYIHDRFTSYPDAGFIVPVGGCIPASGGTCPGSAAGNKLPDTPTTTFNLGGDYKWTLPIGAITLNANYYRSSGFYGAPDNVAVQKAYGLTNASVMWTDQTEHLKAGFYGRNLSNTVYATTLSEGETGENVTVGMPRTYGVTIGYKF